MITPGTVTQEGDTVIVHCLGHILLMSKDEYMHHWHRGKAYQRAKQLAKRLEAKEG